MAHSVHCSKNLIQFVCFTVSSPPMPAAGFSGLTEDELRVLEGQEREGLEARIQVLRNIHTLLDAAMIQMQQYTATVSSQRLVCRSVHSMQVSL